MQSISRFLNPIKRLGQRNYSFWFPFTASISVILISQLYAYFIAHNPMAVDSSYILFIYVALIMYFSFRDGIKGGLITAFFTVAYYVYLRHFRTYIGEQESTDITIIVSFIMLFLAGIIGWLKQTIDTLLGREKDERKRLQTIISQLPVGVIVTDKEGHIVEANRKIDAILGMKVPVGFKVSESSLVEATHNGKKMQPSQGILAQALSTGKPVLGKEIVVTRKDGKNIYIQASASPIHNHEGKVIAAASILTDVTQQKDLEKRKDDFVNMASHELKTPITSMKLYLELLRARLRTDDKNTQKIMSRITYQTEKLQELINDLLDVSRIQTGKLSFNRTEFLFNELIAEIIQDMQDAASNHTIVFRSKQKIKVHADRFRLYQVLTNLLTNAIKYSPEGGEVRVRLKREDGKAIVSVQDVGIGIPKEQQKKIFDRLYQVTDPQEKTFPGLGMGLYISKEIMRRHKGSIWVESQKDKGSTFFISLPVK